MTAAEAVLWSVLRSRPCGFSFKRKALVLGWIVDFYCVGTRLVVELDGPGHDKPEVQASDTIRNQSMVAAGYRVIRFKNDRVVREVGMVVEDILSICKSAAKDVGVSAEDVNSLRDTVQVLGTSDPIGVLVWLSTLHWAITDPDTMETFRLETGDQYRLGSYSLNKILSTVTTADREFILRFMGWFSSTFYGTDSNKVEEVKQ
jgi:very-short-patch-repair endonuclease